MDPLLYWQLKIFQLLHDPPGKPFHLARRGKGSGTKGSPNEMLKHGHLARELFSLFTEADPPRGMTRADRAATGADRPVIAPGWGRGRMTPIPYQERRYCLVCHPLAPRATIELDPSDDAAIVQPHEVRADGDFQREVMSFLGKISFPGWNDKEAVRKAALVLWRRTRDEIALRSAGSTAHAQPDALWTYMPADTRVPDHSIWDHTRMASALSFLDVPMGQKHQVPEAKEPWLLQVSLTPIGEFIGQSRKAQDLWISSFLLADLAWHTMLPIVERYGPENIVYPDLRGNPHVDHWLKRHHAGALPATVEAPCTYAALLPNAFTAIVPQGDAGELVSVRKIATQCSERLQERWQKLASVVLEWFVRMARQRGELTQDDEKKLQQAWAEQHQSVIQARWTAVHWRLPGSDADRANRLKPWVPPAVWERYEEARRVFSRVDQQFAQGERGFDYALTHHQLRVRHGIRKQTAMATSTYEQPGEKCTLCGTRSALGDFGRAPHAGRADIESRREHVRAFWSQKWLDPEQRGAERLCAVCTFKRFLIEADGHGEACELNTTWAGTHEELRPIKDDGDKIVRVPFPSTSAIAAQQFIAAVAKDPSLRQLVERVSAAHHAAGFLATQFPRALRALAVAYEEAAGHEQVQRFLQLDPEETVFPRALDVQLTRNPARAKQIKELQRASQALLDAARATSGEPGKRFAVIRIDGDSMGKLLLGDAARMATTWSDVIHPKQLEKMKKNSDASTAGWPALLDKPRLMGPSLHAFISRALADFTHTIVPWVVEREHEGRLVYAGGDDVLALAPADQAVKIAARLHRFFSSAWVIDTRPNEDAWGWRRADGGRLDDTENASDRFLLLHEGGRLPARPTRLIGMLGPKASLSAGITIGHYKTPLRDMLGHAGYLLDEVAKGTMGRSAVAMSYYTRSGPKYELTMKWLPDEPPQAGENASVDKILEKVTKAFEDGKLPSRLPYKLRDAAGSVHGALDALGDGADSTQLLRGLLRRELDGETLEPSLQEAVLTIWRHGLAVSRERAEREGRDRGETMVDGLLLARAMAAGEREDEE